MMKNKENAALEWPVGRESRRSPSRRSTGEAPPALSPTSDAAQLPRLGGSIQDSGGVTEAKTPLTHNALGRGSRPALQNAPTG
jgi:hypothetical protein